MPLAEVQPLSLWHLLEHALYYDSLFAWDYLQFPSYALPHSAMAELGLYDLDLATKRASLPLYHGIMRNPDDNISQTLMTWTIALASPPLPPAHPPLLAPAKPPRFFFSLTI
jgi:hypothetical protein